ncbi:amino acid adenylation domain-containing protein [Moritella sp.]|uniref:amino acid adenylation domain-containing protein n=1 Tax=Moritella sp. TaxID=78556 RepID=UPI0025E32380|nr:amino acid adenylation domain-containing protein [Moritella sp.]MCJ8351986.1 amino acid adenylation domain-containing protein [Moritella sp.]
MTPSDAQSVENTTTLELTPRQAWHLSNQGKWPDNHSPSNLFYQEFNGENINVTKLECYITILVQRHPMLNSLFTDDLYLQIKSDSQPYRLPIYDLHSYSEMASAEHLARTRATLTQSKSKSKHPFEVHLSLLPENKYRLHIRFTSIAIDHTSANLFFKELCQLQRGLPIPQLEAHSQVLDALIKHTQIQQEKIALNTLFWEKQLLHLPCSPNLPLKCEPDKARGSNFKRRSATITGTEWKQFQSIAKLYQVRSDIALASIFSVVLSRWSNQKDMLIRFDLNERDSQNPNVEHLIGDFTQPLLVGLNGFGSNFQSIAKDNQEKFDISYPFRQVSIFDLVRHLRSISEEHRYTATVSFSSQLDQDHHGKRVRTTLGTSGWGCTQSPTTWLSLHAFVSGGNIVLQWDSQDDLFPDNMIDDMFTTYTKLVTDFCQSTSLWNQALPDLLPGEQQSVRKKLNDSGDTLLQNGLLHDRFWLRAEQSPFAPAVIYGSRTLDYQTLANQARRCAGTLASMGVMPGDRVAVSMNKGIGQIVSVFGILFAGAVYVPVSLDQPKERRELIYREAGIYIVLTEENCSQNTDVENAQRTSSSFTYLDWLYASQGQPMPKAQLVEPTQPAYIIYTSGSTGTPKGVVISHQGALNTCVALNKRYTVNSDDRVLALSALHFDLSVYDIFGLLSAGGAIVLVDESQRRDPRAWSEAIETHQVTMWNSVPALFDMLLTYSSSFKSNAPSKLRLTMLSGDWIGLDLPPRYREFRENGQFIAMGGATEASIWSNIFDVQDVKPHWRSIPYGYPLPRQQYRVVDDFGRDCPNWVAGELWIGGDGVALGYFNDPEKTAAQFIRIDGQPWYRTGDMGCYWPDGNLEFLGRRDKQVKIGGYRIELGEIEAALNNIPNVQRAITMAVGNKDKTLAAFIVGEAASLDAEQVNRSLIQQLPAYMVPKRLFFLETLPLTANGKVDLKALAQLATSKRRRKAKKADKPLDTNSELVLKSIWADILDTADLNKASHFFQLGGDEYSAIKVIRQCHQLDYPINISTLYSHPSLEALALVLDQSRLLTSTP